MLRSNAVQSDGNFLLLLSKIYHKNITKLGMWLDNFSVVAYKNMVVICLSETEMKNEYSIDFAWKLVCEMNICTQLENMQYQIIYYVMIMLV